jgi:transcription elongation factor Elf1
MQLPRPLECPECGHERLARRPVRRRSESGVLRPGISEWICQLCAYAWSHPPVIRRDLMVSMD